MNSEPSVFEILAKWEDAQSAGSPITPEELCANCTELLPEIRRKIAALQLIEDKFGSVNTTNKDISTEPHSLEDDSTAPSELGDSVRNHRASGTWGDASFFLGSQLTVRESFARGGLGEVYHAYDQSLGRNVALKVMLAPLDADPHRRKRFLREAAITGQLEHPGIAPVYAVGQTSEGKLCYAMRFIEGDTLRVAVKNVSVLRHEGKEQEAELELRRLLVRFISVCNTIAFAHSHGILHRDIKPANIVLGPFGETFVVDWGLAKRIGRNEDNTSSADDPSNLDSVCDDTDLTQDDMIVGTPVFMSPEQATPLADVGTATDIYGLGATLFYLLTNQPPISESDALVLLKRIKQGKIDRPRDIVPRLSRKLEAVCLKALSRRPENRYSSALALAADIESYLADQAVTAWPENLWQRLARVTRRNRAITQAAALFLIGLSLITSIFAVAMNHQRQLAQTARSEAEQLAIETQRLADDKTELASREAAAKKLAEQQSALALDTLRSVIVDIQRKLINVSGASEARRSMLQTAIAGLGKVSKAAKSREDADRQLMVALNDIGGIYLTVGQSTGMEASREALECFQRSLNIAQTLATQTPTDETQRDLSVAYEKIGEANWQLGQINEAESAYRQSFNISEQLNRDGRFDRDLAFGYEKLGDIHSEKGAQDAALAAYESSHTYFLSASKHNSESTILKRDVIVSTTKLGNVYLQKGDHTAAEQAYTQCVDQIRNLMTVSDSPVSRRDLSVTLNKLGSVMREEKKHKEAEAAFQESLKVAREFLIEEPNNAQRRRDVTISLNNLGELYLLQRQFEQARQAFAESAEIRRQSLALNPESVPGKVDLAFVLDRLSETESQSGNTDTAREHLNSAWQLMEPLHAERQLSTAFSQELYEIIAKKHAESDRR